MPRTPREKGARRAPKPEAEARFRVYSEGVELPRLERLSADLTPAARRPQFLTGVAALLLLALVGTPCWASCAKTRSGEPATSITADAGLDPDGAMMPDATPLGSGATSAEGAAASAPGAAEAAREGARPEPPAGYIVMKVLDVVPTGSGSVVLLVDNAEEKIVPISIGGTEALSIQLRLEGKRYQRPLTHDLLDSLVGRLGGELIKVQVDELRTDVFIGSVYVRQSDRVVTVDARPSDAIALALGRDAPIFVASKVVNVSAIRKRDLETNEGEGRNRARLPAGHPNPFAL